MNESNAKTCLFCNKQLRGRADKKFCGDSCRNAYNNQLNAANVNIVRNINNRLLKNRRILTELLGEKDTHTVSKQQLADEGFDFTYHTNSYSTQKGSLYYFCYETGYLPLGNDRFLLVKRKDD